jgi:hypothetical protein
MMEWKELFPSDRQPTMEQIEEYIGGNGKKLWKELMDHMEKCYKIKPKFFYSVCAEKPGWNIKLQKSGQSLGTFYPEEDSFSIFLVISYKLDLMMEDVLHDVSYEMESLYRDAKDYMKIGKWMMLKIKNYTDLEDYKLLITAKLKTGK